MNRSIKTYENLLQEEQRLTAQLASYNALVKQDISSVKQSLKDKLNPVKRVKEKVSHLFSQDGKNGMGINLAINFVLDLVIRKVLPIRSNIWTKTVLPFVTKNYVSHLITDEQRKVIMDSVHKVIGKVDHFIRKKMGKHDEEYSMHEPREEYPSNPASTPTFTG